MKTLRELRKERGLSRRALSLATGIHQTLIFNVEGGTARLPSHYVEPWANAIGADPEEVGRHVGGALSLVGLSPSERAKIAALADELRSNRSAA
jgi:transcriptional regulator with XRE-family HTH domain